MSTPLSKVMSIEVVAATAGTDDSKVSEYKGDRNARLVSIRFVPDRAVTAHATNNCDISVEVAGTEVASEVTTSGDTGSLVKNTPIDLALTASGTSLEITDGDDIECKLTKNGTGVAIGGEFILEFKQDRLGAG